MKKKVLGFLLFLSVMFLFIGCTSNRVTATASGSITIELHDGTNLLESKVIEFYEGDSLLDLLMANFTVFCKDSVYILAINSLEAYGSNEYLAFFINNEYAMSGVDSTEPTDGHVYLFKHDTF